jgi:hypothetical protein
MNYKLITHKGGGIFSILVDIALMRLIDLPDAENVFLEVKDNEYNIPRFGFNHIFDQTCDESYQIIEAGFIRAIREPEKSIELSKLKRAINLFKIKDILIEVPPNTLGIHVRIADMNARHGKDYGIKTIDNYFKAIDLVRDNYDHIYVASDNYESIDKIQKRYNNVLCSGSMIRGENERSDTMKVQMDNSGDERFWMEAMTDVMGLSKCKGLVCRTSNFSNAAIIWSDTLTKIYRT